MIIKMRSILLLMLSVVIILIMAIAYIANSINSLCLIASSSDRPSYLYYIAMERIYKLSSYKDRRISLVESLESDSDSHLLSIRVILLGVIGAKESTGYLIKTFVDCLNDPNRKGTAYNIIDSLGLIGDEMAVPFLERILYGYDTYRIPVPRYSLYRSLYLITGNNYSCSSNTDECYELKYDEALANARSILLTSKDRPRTFKEMMELDRLLRPPKWRE